MAARLPKLPVQPGEYAVEWLIDDRVIPGELGLEPNRPPEARLFGDVVERDWGRGGGFPENHTFERIRGRLRSGLDVVLTDAHVSIWFPERSLGSARHAVVGSGVAAALGDAYPRMRCQITDLDLLFGASPVTSVSWPAEGTPPLHGHFGIDLNPDAHHEWPDDANGITLECTYDIQFPLSSGHEHYVAFAPTVMIAVDAPLTVDQWVSEWVMPLVRLATLATRRPQRLSWLTVNTASRSALEDERMRSNTGTVFGSGIEQAPYEAEYREGWREAENRPLFTLASLPISLPDLVRRWRALDLADNPFMELYGLALRQADLPPRARYLYLVQALEALHSLEHEDEDAEAQDEFERRRSEALEELRKVELPDGIHRFVKQNWGKRRIDSLDRRLKCLIDQLPELVQGRLTPPPGEVVTALVADGDLPIESLFRVLRNDLSHGNRHYPDPGLRPWVTLVETLCRAHALRLLGFDETAIVSGLASPPAPVPANHVPDGRTDGS